MSMLEVVRESAKEDLVRPVDLLVGDVFVDAEDGRVMMAVDISVEDLEDNTDGSVFAIELESGELNAYGPSKNRKLCKLMKSARLYCKE